MARTAKWPPPISKHRSGQARVTIKGKDYYIGPYGSPEAQQAYLELIQRHARTGTAEPETPASSITVSELVCRFLEEAGRARQKHGKPTKELVSLRYAVRPLLHHLGPMLANEVAPRHLREVRQLMVDGWAVVPLKANRPQSLVTVKNNFTRVKSVFKWGAQEGLVPAENWHRLSLVRQLRKGESGVEALGEVQPVPEADLAATLAELGRIPRAMVAVQLLCGCRPGELIQMRPCDIARTGTVWTWTLREHKNAWRGHERQIFIGPQAQRVLEPFLDRAPEAYCFSPAESAEEARPGSRKRQDGHAPGERYTTWSYRQAVLRACKRAKVTHWSPSRLRHSAATMLASRFGWDAARIILGHKHIQTTRIYAQDDATKAVDAMKQAG